jgi:hypothetical protein
MISALISGNQTNTCETIFITWGTIKKFLLTFGCTLAFLTSIYSKASEQNLFLLSLLSEDIAIVDETEIVIYMSVVRDTA